MFGLRMLQSLVDVFPTTLYSAYKMAGISVDDFEKWVVCPKCNSLYKFEECFVERDKIKVSKNCSSTVPFKKDQLCNTRLLNSKTGTNGTKILYPRKEYCSRKISTTIEKFLERPGFEKLLLQKRVVSDSDDELNDIYDGKIWKTFKGDDGQLFFTDPRNLGLMMNIDWFQPFSNSEYSLGIIYMVILNLPREERFKYDNLIVCGIIPGPKEPSLHVNTFLGPIVDDLHNGWNGVLLNDDSTHGKSLYKYALISLSSDIPATRKCCGFLTFAANLGRLNSISKKFVSMDTIFQKKIESNMSLPH